jgi:hypothetical protein
VITPETITEFRRQVVSAKDIGTAVDFFFDRLVADPSFLKRGHPVPEVPNTIQEIVGNVARAIFNRDCLAISFQLVNVPEYQFIHGHLLINGCQAMLVWLPDAQVGILTVAKSLKPGGTVFARLSVCPAVTGSRKPN